MELQGPEVCFDTNPHLSHAESDARTGAFYKPEEHMKTPRRFLILMANLLAACTYGVILAYATVNMIAPPSGNQYFGPAHYQTTQEGIPA